MREAERENQPVALLLSAVADAIDLERLLEAGRHAGDHVCDERARQAVELLVRPTLGRAAHLERAVLADDLHGGMEVALELALRAFDGDVGALERDLDVARDGDRRS